MEADGSALSRREYRTCARSVSTAVGRPGGSRLDTSQLDRPWRALTMSEPKEPLEGNRLVRCLRLEQCCHDDAPNPSIQFQRRMDFRNREPERGGGFAV